MLSSLTNNTAMPHMRLLLDLYNDHDHYYHHRSIERNGYELYVP